MKLQLEPGDGQNTFTGYGEGYVSVNGVRHRGNLLVLPERLWPDWTSASFATLCLEDIELLAALEAEVVLLGTGDQLRFPRPELLRPFVEARRGLEVMDVRAACRTYNILKGEGRRVAAGLLIE